MSYKANKVNETIFRGLLNGDKEALTLNTLTQILHET